VTYDSVFVYSVMYDSVFVFSVIYDSVFVYSVIYDKVYSVILAATCRHTGGTITQRTSQGFV